MTVSPLGDTAVVLTFAGEINAAMAGRVVAVAGALRRELTVQRVDVVPAFRSVTVVFGEPRESVRTAIMTSIRAIASGLEASVVSSARTVEIPVCYEAAMAPDLAELAAAKGLSAAEVVALHTGAEYRVHAIGFAPGFPYLGGLPAALATPRRSTPRSLVPAGAVGIGGAQTGIYPFATPGGWNLIGRTPIPLFDVGRATPSLLAAGDRVRFRAISAREFEAATPVQPILSVPATTSKPVLTVLRPGLHTSIQDLGRAGRRHEGVALGGAADAFSLRLLNLLVGNDEGAAGMEFTLVGPTVRFESDAIVAVGGAHAAAFPSWQPCRVAAGTTVDFGPLTAGCRGYLAVAGGLDVPVVLGGRGLHSRAGFGGGFGRPLAAGDQVAGGEVAGPVAVGGWRVDPRILPPSEDPCVLRVLPDADGVAFHAAAWAATYQTSAKSDRMGARLQGPALTGEAAGDRVSAAVLPGTVQVPPDGQPIVLLADAQTIGGYPRLGHVIAADLRKAAQLRPGAKVRFQPVTLAEADAAHAAGERALGLVRQGIAGKRGRG